MLILALIGISLVGAFALFFLGWLWYSHKVFGSVMAESLPKDYKHEGMKTSIALEFVSCFLIALAVSFIFGPFDWYFGFINSVILILSIVLPFAISDFAWCPRKSIKLFLVKFGHRSVQLLLAFMLVGFLNSIILPRLLDAGVF